MKTKTIRPTPSGVWPQLPNGVHDISLGNGTRFDVMLHKEHGKLALGIAGRGCYVFNPISPDAGYVGSKLGLQEYLGDAAILADFINDQWEPGTAKRQGQYVKAFCAKPAATFYHSNGETRTIEPKNGTDFVFEGELYGLLDTNMIPVVPLGEDLILLIDEDAKVRHDKPPVHNAKATAIARPYIAPTDYIAGHAVVCPTEMLK